MEDIAIPGFLDIKDRIIRGQGFQHGPLARQFRFQGLDFRLQGIVAGHHHDSGKGQDGPR